jgi:hypothetical protein
VGRLRGWYGALSPSRRFFVLLGAITLAGFVLRLVFALTSTWNDIVFGDAFNFHYAANGLAKGHGFQNWWYKPYATPEILEKGPAFDNVVSFGRAADYRPVYPLYLAVWSLVGADGFHAHIIATLLLGCATIVVVGLVGRTIGGDRVGIISALLAAFYANFWMYDGWVMSESMSILVTALIVLLAYKVWREPTLQRVIGLGALCGFATLIRSELLILAPFLMVPFVVRRLGGQAVKKRVGWLLAAGAAAFLVMSPWVIRNLVSFEKPLYLTADQGVTLAATNCDGAYYGRLLGWWDGTCITNPDTYPKGDVSQRNAAWRKRATDYISDHKGRFPVVVAARVGRMWGLYKPGTPWGCLCEGQTLALDVLEGRQARAARLALAQYYVLMPFAIAGLVIMWRRKQVVTPLLVLPIIVTLTAAAAFGTTRYRAVAEVAIAVFAAVALDAVVRRYWDGRGARKQREPAPVAQPEEASVSG